MKRLIVVPVLAVAGVLLFAVMAGGAGTNGPRVRLIHVIEHATSDTVTDTGATDDSVGDILTFANDVYNARNTRIVGSDQGYCIRTEVGVSWECNYTTFLRGGQIVVEGPFYDAANSTFAITGGTGAFKNARGQLALRSRHGGTEFDFIFRVIG